MVSCGGDFKAVHEAECVSRVFDDAFVDDDCSVGENAFCFDSVLCAFEDFSEEYGEGDAVVE